MPGQFPILSTGSAFKYPVRRKSVQRSTAHTFCDFSEVRYQKGFELTEFVLEYRRISEADKETLRIFYGAQGGEAATDWILIFDDVLYRNCQFVGIFNAKNTSARIWTVTLQVRCLRGTGTSGSTLLLPHGTISSATLNVTSEHIPNPDWIPNFGAGATLTGVSFIFPVPDWFHDTAAWGKRTNSRGVDPNSVLTGSLYVLLMLEQDGTASPALSPADEFRIYNCWVDVVYEDGTTGVYQPSANAQQIIGVGAVSSPQLAYDADPDSYATLTVTQYDSFLSGTFLNLNTFVPVS